MSQTIAGAIRNELERYGSASSVASNSKVMVNGDIIFTITGGPIAIVELVSVCDTANDATASTLQYKSTPTVGSAVTFSGASASLAVAGTGAGASVRLTPTALTTAPVVVAATASVSLGLVAQNKIIVQAGTIKTVIGVGSTTGKWTHYLHYIPMGKNVVVS